jgi:hypothetical protein
MQINLTLNFGNKHSVVYISLFCFICIMYFLGVLMSRSKSNTKSTGDNSSFVSQTTAAMLLQAGVIDYCLILLKALLQYWKRYGATSECFRISAFGLMTNLIACSL